MLRKLNILIISLFLFCNLAAQEKYEISKDYHGLAFKDFVTKAENNFHIKFYYKEEWVNDLVLGVYPDGITLSQVLDNLFTGKSIFYFIDEAGTVILTKDFAIKIPDPTISGEKNYILPTEYDDSRQGRQQAGNIVVDIGNPADRNKTGNVAISGYITNRDSREPVSGVTVFVQNLLAGAVSNENGFYSLTLPRGSHLIQFSFIGMKEKSINVNLNGAGEMNVEMNSMLIPLKETVISAQKSSAASAVRIRNGKDQYPHFQINANLNGRV